MRVRAAVLDEVGGRMRSTELELDPPRDDEVLVRLAATGVYTLDQVGQALDDLEAGRVRRGVVVLDDAVAGRAA